MWILYGAGAAGTVLIGVAAYYGVFRTVTFEDGILPAKRFYYIEFKGPYKSVNKLFQKVC
jgi:hypothetical protein